MERATPSHIEVLWQASQRSPTVQILVKAAVAGGLLGRSLSPADTEPEACERRPPEGPGTKAELAVLDGDAGQAQRRLGNS